MKQIDMGKEIEILEENATQALNAAIMFAEMGETRLCLLNVEQAKIILRMLQERSKSNYD